MDSVRGQQHATAALRAALSGGRVPHALLFSGPAGVGKATAAREVAKALLCAGGPAAYCGSCGPCRRVDAGTHSDLYILAPQAQKASITVEEIRDISRRLYESPMEGSRKAAIIDPADLMTVGAQNALLKTLEEPPDDTTIILIAENTDALLPTVRSRCRRVDFRRLAVEEVEDFLASQGVDKENARQIAVLSDGSFGAALELVDGTVAVSRRELAGAVMRATRKDVSALTERIASGDKPARKSLKDKRQETRALLAVLESFVVDAMRVAARSDVRTNTDMVAEISSFAEAVGLDALSALEKEVSDGIIVLGQYADVRLVAMRIVGAFAAANESANTQIEAS